MLGKAAGIRERDLLCLMDEHLQFFEPRSAQLTLVVLLYQFVKTALLMLRQGLNHGCRISEDDKIVELDFQRPADRSHHPEVDALERPIRISEPVERLNVDGAIFGMELRPQTPGLRAPGAAIPRQALVRGSATPS